MSERVSTESKPFGLDDVDLVVCDVDGVLVRSHLFEDMQSRMALTWAGQIPRYGAHPDEDIVLSDDDTRAIDNRIREATIYSNGDPKRHYEKLLGMELDERFWRLHRWMVKALANLQMPDKYGVKMLGELHRAGKYTAAFTSRDRDLLTPELAPGVILPRGEGPKTHGWFDVIISADDVGVDARGNRRLKPDTAGLEIIHDRLAVPYEKTLMVGDRPSDIIPAKRLGALACAVYNSRGYMNRQDLEAVRPDVVVDSVAGLYKILFEAATHTASSKQSS